ncbi:MAG: hypothetical protein ACRC3A_05430, partial [Culicoidibacterales bacterium]
MKKISPYLGLYRAMFIVTILIALAYATFNFFQYQNSMRELTINNKPSVQIENNYTERLQMYEAYQLEKEKNPELYADKTATFDVLPTRENTASELFGDPLSAPISELDVLWLNGLYAALVGSTLTFLFALATIVSALFALNTKRIAAFLAP